MIYTFFMRQLKWMVNYDESQRVIPCLCLFRQIYEKCFVYGNEVVRYVYRAIKGEEMGMTLKVRALINCIICEDNGYFARGPTCYWVLK